MLQKIVYIFLGVVALGLIGLAAGIGRSLISGSGIKNPPLETAEIILAGETFRVELARTVGEKALGLSGREGLTEGDGSAGSPHGGMLFLFREPSPQNFWMKDMLFPIDIIWIKENVVVGFVENAKPESGKKLWELAIYFSPEPVDKVLEVRAGTAARLGLSVGDIVIFR